MTSSDCVLRPAAISLTVMSVVAALSMVPPSGADERKADSGFIKHTHMKKDGHYNKKANETPPGHHGASSEFPDCRFYSYDGSNTPSNGMTWREEFSVLGALAQRARDGAGAAGGSVDVVGFSTCRYNCFAFAFGAGTNVWYEIDSGEQWGLILKSYSLVTGPAEVGDVCVWGPSKDSLPVHAGVVTEVKGGKATRVRSKWGHGPLMDHPPESAATMYGSAVGYFRKKPSAKK